MSQNALQVTRETRLALRRLLSEDMQSEQVESNAPEGFFSSGHGTFSRLIPVPKYCPFSRRHILQSGNLGASSVTCTRSLHPVTPSPDHTHPTPLRLVSQLCDLLLNQSCDLCVSTWVHKSRARGSMTSFFREAPRSLFCVPSC